MVMLALLLLAAFLGFIAYITWQKRKQVEGVSTSNLNYVCLECGHAFKGRQCPNCGSKSKRAVF